jgi:hypothetical protein
MCIIHDPTSPAFRPNIQWLHNPNKELDSNRSQKNQKQNPPSQISTDRQTTEAKQNEAKLAGT